MERKHAVATRVEQWAAQRVSFVPVRVDDKECARSETLTLFLVLSLLWHVLRATCVVVYLCVNQKRIASYSSTCGTLVKNMRRVVRLSLLVCLAFLALLAHGVVANDEVQDVDDAVDIAEETVEAREDEDLRQAAADVEAAARKAEEEANAQRLKEEAAAQARHAQEAATRAATEAKETVSNAAEDAKEDAENAMVKIKSKATDLIKTVSSETKGLVDKAKNISPSDAKKIAAGVLGVWGVSVGAGWLAQNINKQEEEPAKGRGRK